MVEVKNATVIYGSGQESLKNITLSVPNGQFCFITGRSGSGKSTVSKLITGEVRATSGDVHINGYNMGEISGRTLAEARRTIGMVFQDYRLIQSLTVAQNLEFAMCCIGINGDSIPLRIAEVLSVVDLEGHEDKYPAELSGGEQQRVAIARAIINHPTTILADEPTGNLDPEMAKEIMNLFHKINQETGTTVIIITHALDLVRCYKDARVICMEAGMIAKDNREDDRND